MFANLITDERRAATADQDAAHVEGLGDPRTDARLGLPGVQEDRREAAERPLSGPNSGGFDQVAEHPVAVLAAVVAPRPFVQVALKPLVRDGVMSATDTRLEQAEEPVNGLRMHVPVHVDAGVMLD